MNHRGKAVRVARDDFVQQLRSDFAKTAEHKQIVRTDDDTDEKRNVVGGFKGGKFKCLDFSC